MSTLGLLVVTLLLTVSESKVTTRVNATGAIDTFLISNCDECT